MMIQRTATALTWLLMLVGALTACGADDSVRPTPGNGTSMMRTQSQPQSDLGGHRSFEENALPHQLATWCQGLLDDGSWSARERTQLMRAMHRRMQHQSEDRLWNDSHRPMTWSERMAGLTMTTRDCHSTR
jgi:hypothetical protein